jgi:hypothetical protein
MSDQARVDALAKIPIPDFSGAVNFEDIQRRFFASAEKILRGYCLARGPYRWPITSLELYLHTASDVWRDPYTHRHKEQKNRGTWYVHRHPRCLSTTEPPKRFRAVRRSGLDITCGSEKECIFGGILIRQTCGSAGSGAAFIRIIRPDPRLRLERWSDSEKDIVCTIDGASVTRGELKLLRSDVAMVRELWIGPRVGLKAKRASPSAQNNARFIDAELRVATHKAAGRMRPL